MEYLQHFTVAIYCAAEDPCRIDGHSHLSLHSAITSRLFASMCVATQNSAEQEWKDHITAINLSTLDDNTLEIEVRNNGTVRPCQRSAEYGRSGWTGVTAARLQKLPYHHHVDRPRLTFCVAYHVWYMLPYVWYVQYSDRFLGVVTLPLKVVSGSSKYQGTYALQDPQVSQ